MSDLISKIQQAQIRAGEDAVIQDLIDKGLITAPAAAPTQEPPVAWACTDYDGHVDVGVTKEKAKSRAGESCNEFFPLYTHPAPTDAALLADARRYRWLRKGQHYVLMEYVFGRSYVRLGNLYNDEVREKLDAAIDAALKGRP